MVTIRSSTMLINEKLSSKKNLACHVRLLSTLILAFVQRAKGQKGQPALPCRCWFFPLVASGKSGWNNVSTQIVSSRVGWAGAA
jgi:hypothetical protein